MLGVGFDICESVQSESVRRFRTTHTEVLPALAGVRRTGGAEEERRVRSSFWGHFLLEIFETGHVSHARRYSPRRMRNPRRANWISGRPGQSLLMLRISRTRITSRLLFKSRE